MSGRNPARRIGVESRVVCGAEGAGEGIDDFFKPGTIGQKEIISTFVIWKHIHTLSNIQ